MLLGGIEFRALVDRAPVRIRTGEQSHENEFESLCSRNLFVVRAGYAARGAGAGEGSESAGSKGG